MAAYTPSTPTTAYHVAASQFGDATQFDRIMTLNGLSDPQIAAGVAVQLPPVNPNAGGGVPAQ